MKTFIVTINDALLRAYRRDHYPDSHKYSIDGKPLAEAGVLDLVLEHALIEYWGMMEPRDIQVEEVNGLSKFLLAHVKTREAKRK